MTNPSPSLKEWWDRLKAVVQSRPPKRIRWALIHNLAKALRTWFAIALAMWAVFAVIPDQGPNFKLTSQMAVSKMPCDSDFSGLARQVNKLESNQPNSGVAKSLARQIGPTRDDTVKWLSARDAACSEGDASTEATSTFAVDPDTVAWGQLDRNQLETAVNSAVEAGLVDWTWDDAVAWANSPAGDVRVVLAPQGTDETVARQQFGVDDSTLVVPADCLSVVKADKVEEQCGINPTLILARVSMDDNGVPEKLVYGSGLILSGDHAGQVASYRQAS